MTTWILAALLLYFVQTLLPALTLYLIRPDPQLRLALGPRDTPPDASPVSGRFGRALSNYQEALFIFLPLALMTEFLAIRADLSTTGAMLFLVARVLYVPAYVSGVLGLRSLIWGGGFLGLIMMTIPLIEKV